jgi:hypothetical protein
MTALECHSQENPVVAGPPKWPIAKNATIMNASAYSRRGTLSSSDVTGELVSMACLMWSQRVADEMMNNRMILRVPRSSRLAGHLA